MSNTIFKTTHFYEKKTNVFDEVYLTIHNTILYFKLFIFFKSKIL